MPSDLPGGVGGAGQGAALGASFGPWGALAGGLAGAAYGWWNSSQQSAEQRRVLNEQLRRQKMQQAQVLGTATARGAASGIEFESASLQGLLSEMQAEFDRQNAWTRRSGMAAANATDAAGKFNFVADLGSSLFRFGGANNWWRSPPGGNG